MSCLERTIYINNLNYLLPSDMYVPIIHPSPRTSSVFTLVLIFRCWEHNYAKFSTFMMTFIRENDIEIYMNSRERTLQPALCQPGNTSVLWHYEETSNKAQKVGVNELLLMSYYCREKMKKQKFSVLASRHSFAHLMPNPVDAAPQPLL